jgi:hypothetical protein
VDRLVAAGEVDDAEPLHPEAEIAIGHQPLMIGAAMRDRGALRGDQRAAHRAATARVQASDAADDYSPFMRLPIPDPSALGPIDVQGNALAP